ncbi:MAG: hypothetical protein KY393_08705, partial [Actinobacteria bacterium]|nr:hypothetical protein [Actinomycetota bacterium]
MKVLDKVLRAGEGRKFKKVGETAALVNDWEPEIQALSDAELQAKTPEFRARHEEGESLDDLLPEAFAVVREA